jgi:hypothetical protein
MKRTGEGNKTNSMIGIKSLVSITKQLDIFSKVITRAMTNWTSRRKV